MTFKCKSVDLRDCGTRRILNKYHYQRRFLRNIYLSSVAQRRKKYSYIYPISIKLERVRGVTSPAGELPPQYSFPLLLFPSFFLFLFLFFFLLILCSSACRRARYAPKCRETPRRQLWRNSVRSEELALRARKRYRAPSPLPPPLPPKAIGRKNYERVALSSTGGELFFFPPAPPPPPPPPPSPVGPRRALAGVQRTTSDRARGLADRSLIERNEEQR